MKRPVFPLFASPLHTWQAGCIKTSDFYHLLPLFPFSCCGWTYGQTERWNPQSRFKASCMIPSTFCISYFLQVSSSQTAATRAATRAANSNTFVQAAHHVCPRGVALSQRRRGDEPFGPLLLSTARLPSPPQPTPLRASSKTFSTTLERNLLQKSGAV